MRRFAIFATIVLVLGLMVTGVAHADDPGPWANNIPPDPSTLKPMPPPSPLEQAVAALKEATSAKVSKVNNLRRQNLISHDEWWVALMEIRAEVDAAKRGFGLPVAEATQRGITGGGAAGLLYDADDLGDAMAAVSQYPCGNWCGPACAKEVLDYEDHVYGGNHIALDTIAEGYMGLECDYVWDPQDLDGSVLGGSEGSIEAALEYYGETTWQLRLPSSQSGWFDDIVTSISTWSYPQVQLVRPNWDGTGSESLYQWEGCSINAHHYIVISGYNGIDENVRYEESAWWAPGTYWWPAHWVWETLANANASEGGAYPYKLVW